MANRKDKNARFLVVVDASAGSKRALEYMSGVIAGRRNFAITVLQLLPPLPPELLEFGGAENSRKEQALEAKLRSDQQSYIRATRKSAQTSLAAAVDQLHKAGIPREDIQIAFTDPAADRDAATAVLEQARSKRCRTVVIGHASHSWFRELTGGDLVEHLLRRAKGIAMWVVQ